MSERRIAALLALLVFVSAAYFHNGGGWNQNARLDAIYAFVEPGPDQFTFRIDRFITDPDKGLNTGDWSRAGDHYYSNKAPGTILLGILVYGPLYVGEVAAGWAVDDPFVEIANAYLINLFVSVLPLCAAAVVFFRLLLREGTPRARATWVTVIAFVATGLFPYATQLWGHPTTAAFVIFALSELRKGTARSIAWAGAWVGLAVCTDYLAGIVLVVFGVHLLAVRPRRLPTFVAGGVLPAVILLVYHWYCFGTPFTSAMHHSNPRVVVHGLAVGLFGAVTPEAAWGLLIGRYRGIFTGMPILAAGVAGWWYWARRAPRDHLLWLCVILFVCFYVVNAADAFWYGGSSVLARYLIPVFPLMVLALKELPSTRRWNAIVGVLAAASALNMLVIASVTLLPPPRDPDPLFGWGYRFFLRGEIAPFMFFIRLQHQNPAYGVFGPWTAFNWGEVLGLRSWASLAPLAAAWTLIGVLLGQAARRGDSVKAAGP